MESENGGTTPFEAAGEFLVGRTRALGESAEYQLA